MQATRPFAAFRSSLHASSSRTPHRTPSSDRYLAIHAFFTRQAQVHTLSRPLRPAHSSPLLRVRFNSHDAASPPHSSSSSSSSSGKPCPNCPNPKSDSRPPTTPQRGHAQEYTPFIARLLRRSPSFSPDSPHRPSKEELLAAASSWWERLRVRIKWFTIRGWRRFNTDDLSAFASWFVVGNTLWILIGTTTFVSAVFATLNSLSLQASVARWISDYMTSETGVTVIFESAIVPKWGASTITFRNVYVSRRSSSASDAPSSTSEHHTPTAAQKRTATAKPPSPVPFLTSALSPDTYLAPQRAPEADNYTMFDINLDQVEVTLSFMRWLDGKGLVKDARVKGVRGVVDRRSVWWDTTKPLLPADYRHATQPGDFELDSFHIEDALITVYQPGGQRPYNVSIFNAAIGPLRKRWLFFDMMSAEAITGQFDNCLFSLHMPQKLGRVSEEGGSTGLVKRMARFRIDGLPIEHAQYASGHQGPMSWITSGKLDAVLDIKFPFHPDDDSVDLKALFEEIGRNVEAISHGAHPQSLDAFVASETARPIGDKVIPGQARLARPPLRAPSAGNTGDDEEDDGAKRQRQVTVDIDLRFRDLKAAVPIYTSDLSVANNAFIRPIVAFINANRTLVPIHCQVAADLSDFDGSWTLFETGLMTSLSDQIYEALAHHVSSEGANSKRLRQVSVWGIQRGAEVLVETLRNVVDPVRGELGAAF